MPPGSEIRLDGRAGALLLATLTLAAWANSFLAVPQFDDWAVIFDEARVASLAAWWQSMPGMRPLLKLSYALNRSAGGVAGFHAVNLAIHLGCVLLTWRLWLRLLPGLPGAAFAGALLFALHPVAAESVTLLSGRSVSLSTLAVLGSLLAFLGGRTGVSLLLFAAAVAVRETALVLPALALLCHLCVRPTAGGGGFGAALRATCWHWLLAIGLLLAVLALPRYRELLAYSLALRPPLQNLVSQSGAGWWLVSELFRPFGLNADPRLPAFAGWNASWAAACAAWVLVLGAAVQAFRRGAWWGFAVLWFLVCLLPTNSLIARLDLANGRQLYLAALPLHALAGVGLVRLGERLPRAGLVAAVALAMLLAVATVLRNLDFRSETAFWSSVLAVDAGNARAWNNLGIAIEQENPADTVAALAAYERAIALDPGGFKARHNARRLRDRLQAGH